MNLDAKLNAFRVVGVELVIWRRSSENFGDFDATRLRGRFVKLKSIERNLTSIYTIETHL